MDQQHIANVQSTWKSVEAIAPQAAGLFYQNLFDADPALRVLFPGDMTVQGERLMQMIGEAVSRLDDLDSLVPILQDLGMRHVRYGVESSHYETVGGALLKTLQQGLGPAFTPEVEQAWTVVYQAMADVMISAAKHV